MERHVFDEYGHEEEGNKLELGLDGKWRNYKYDHNKRIRSNRRSD
jgi:hypothetical protein